MPNAIPERVNYTNIPRGASVHIDQAVFYTPLNGARSGEEGSSLPRGWRHWIGGNMMAALGGIIQQITVGCVDAGLAWGIRGVIHLYKGSASFQENNEQAFLNQMMETAYKIQVLAGKEGCILDQNGNLSLGVLQMISQEQDLNMRRDLLNAAARCVEKNTEKKEAEKKRKEMPVRVSWYAWICSSVAKIFQNLFRPVSSSKTYLLASSPETKLGSLV